MMFLKQLSISDDELKRRYIIGESANRLSKECNVCCQTIIRRLEYLDVPVRRKVSSVCLILQKHYMDLQNDPEKLSEEFILKLVNGGSDGEQI